MKVHCLFEQSGTFKNVFKARGIDAIDYDICNDFNETDVQTDLFKAIRGGYRGGKTLFDEMSSDDLILAFFPCTRFEDQVKLYFRGDSLHDYKLSLDEKLERDMQLMDELHELYDLVTMLVLVCIRKNLRLIIENPNSPDHLLKSYWALKPTIIDNDRSRHGDYFKKPTKYYFVNCQPKNELKPIIEYPKTKHTVNDAYKAFENVTRRVARSMISPEYASYFVDHYLIDLVKEGETCKS